MFSRVGLLAGPRTMIMEALDVPDKSSFLRLVRWRKRRWAPVNQSKIFFVPERKPRNEEELKELKTVYDQYHTHIKAIRWMDTDIYRAVANHLHSPIINYYSYLKYCHLGTRANLSFSEHCHCDWQCSSWQRCHSHTVTIWQPLYIQT